MNASLVIQAAVARGRSLRAAAIGLAIALVAPAVRADGPTAEQRRARIDMLLAAGEQPCAVAREYEALAVGGDPRDHQLAVLHFRRCLRDGGPNVDRADVEARIALLLSTRPAPSPSAPLTGVPLQVSAYAPGRVYAVSLESPGAPAARCTTPCVLRVPPGPVHLRGEGSGEIEADLAVPPVGGALRIQHREASAEVLAGATLIPTGVVMASTMWLLARTCSSASCYAANQALWPIVGVSTFAAGVALLAHGLRLPEDANRVLIFPSFTPQPRAATAGLIVTF